MNTFRLCISSPDGILYKRDAVFLSLRGADGDLAIMAGHVPFVTSVKHCRCKVVFPDEGERTGITEGGLLTVSKESVTLLSGSFHWCEKE